MLRPLRTPSLLALLCLVGACGCGSQAILLEAEGEYLFIAFDALALPGEEVQLRARLLAGDLLEPQAGFVVRFLRGGDPDWSLRLYKAAETDEEGMAIVSFVPDEPGLYRFTAELSPNGFPGAPPAPQQLLIACRRSDEPAMVVDLDKTLVASGFHLVLVGQPEPMPGSAEVMRRLARRHSVIYLTHRPDYFGPKSKAWLRRHNYPEGPVLLADIGGFLAGSGEFKARAIRRLRARFKKIQIGIGDKISDARSYHENGMSAFLILDVPPSPTAGQLREIVKSLQDLPEQVQVVTSWAQIEEVIFKGGSYPPSRARRALEKQAQALELKERSSRGK